MINYFLFLRSLSQINVGHIAGGCGVALDDCSWGQPRPDQGLLINNKYDNNTDINNNNNNNNILN